MFNINLIRQNSSEIKAKLANKNFDVSQIDIIYNLDVQNRDLKTKIETLLFSKNKISKEIGIHFQNKNIDGANKLQQEVKNINDELSSLELEQQKIENQLTNMLMIVPNICADDVPIGKDETQNKPISYFSEPTKFDFVPLAHWELAEKLNLVNFEIGTKISGSRFVAYFNEGAKLYRALQQFTIDHNLKNGFVEVLPPVVINEKALYGTGQLPKFAEDVYKLTGDENFYLSPTAEVQLTNIHSNEIISETPKRYTSNTPCFRSEAGSAGRDTKGVLRLHQFYKTELVVVCDPDESWHEHERMTRVAESILEELKLPYRRLLLCSGDTGFSSAKTYDLEVWLPSYNDYKEISSCSNCLDFQARRAMIRCKKDGKNIYAHTLNGSSLAIDRLWSAIVENYQQKDGTILIPDALIPYFQNQRKIG